MQLLKTFINHVSFSLSANASPEMFRCLPCWEKDVCSNSSFYMKRPLTCNTSWNQMCITVHDHFSSFRTKNFIRSSANHNLLKRNTLHSSIFNGKSNGTAQKNHTKCFTGPEPTHTLSQQCSCAQQTQLLYLKLFMSDKNRTVLLQEQPLSSEWRCFENIHPIF